MSHPRTIAYGATIISYDLTFTRRKTLGIIVRTDSQVAVRAPFGVSFDEVDRIVQKRGAWIQRKKAEFDRYPPKAPPRQYIEGEAHSFLGSSYRLKIVEGKPGSVQLDQELLLISVRDKDNNDRVKRLLIEWYRRQARHIFAERLAACYPKIQSHGVPYPELKIRLMKKRWGSCSSNGRINLNLRLIQAPEPTIDYVIIHELCHLKVHNHSQAYYVLLDLLLPDWRQRREELNQLDIA